MVHLPDFKTILDTKDHTYTIRMVRTVSERLATSLDRDRIYRYRTETLAVLTTEESVDGRPTERVIEDLFLEPFNLEDKPVMLTARILTVPLSRMEDVDIVSVIEHGLVTEGLSPGVHLHRIDSKDIKGYLREQAIIRLMRNQLDEGEIDVVFQPILDLKRGRFTSAEALARLSSEDLGDIKPSEFIPIAERAGLIHALGMSVIRTSSRLMRKLQEKDSVIRQVAINLSSHQIADTSFSKSVVRTCKDEGIRPSSLSFEVTESVWVRNNSDLLRLAKSFKNEGIKLLLDDFGTGYANLEAVYSGIFETVKFDGMLFRNLSKGPAGHDTIANLIALFSSLGVKTTVEGVESPEQEHDAIAAKADSLQGFLIKRPIPAAEILQL